MLCFSDWCLFAAAAAARRLYARALTPVFHCLPLLAPSTALCFHALSHWGLNEQTEDSYADMPDVFCLLSFFFLFFSSLFFIEITRLLLLHNHARLFLFIIFFSWERCFSSRLFLLLLLFFFRYIIQHDAFKPTLFSLLIFILPSSFLPLFSLLFPSFFFFFFWFSVSFLHCLDEYWDH